MFCDNCGKSNATGVVTCAYCGSEMPKTTECAGFGDILTYKAPEPVAPVTAVLENDDSRRIYETDTKNSLEESGGKTKVKKSNIIIAAIGSLVLIVSIIIGVSIMSCEDRESTPGNKVENPLEEKKEYSTFDKLGELAEEIGGIINQNPEEYSTFDKLGELAEEIGGIIKGDN